MENIVWIDCIMYDQAYKNKLVRQENLALLHLIRKIIHHDDDPKQTAALALE